MPDRWLRRTPQEEFREQVRLLRHLHWTSMNDEEPSRRQHARQQWFDAVQSLLEGLAEQPTVWRGVNEPPATPWQAVLSMLGTGNPLIWFVFGVMVFGWATGLIKFPFLG